MPLKSRASSNTVMGGTRKKRILDIIDQELHAINNLEPKVQKEEHVRNEDSSVKLLETSILV